MCTGAGAASMRVNFVLCVRRRGLRTGREETIPRAAAAAAAAVGPEQQLRRGFSVGAARPGSIHDAIPGWRRGCKTRSNLKPSNTGQQQRIPAVVANAAAATSTAAAANAVASSAAATASIAAAGAANAAATATSTAAAASAAGPSAGAALVAVAAAAVAAAAAGFFASGALLAVLLLDVFVMNALLQS